MRLAEGFCHESGMLNIMSGRHERTSEDVRFERKIHAAYGQLCELTLYTKLVGVMDTNWDRTNRQAAIRTLAQAQPLYLQPESIHNGHGILMVNANGRGVGYLEERVAMEVFKSLREGREWHAHVRRVDHAERSDCCDVIILLLLMISPERYLQVMDSGYLQNAATSVSTTRGAVVLHKDFSIEWTLLAVFLLGIAITMI